MASRPHRRSDDEFADPNAPFQNDMADLFKLINTDATISDYFIKEGVVTKLELEKDNFSVYVVLPLLALNGLDITTLRDCIDRANEGKLTLSPQSLSMISELYHTSIPKHPLIVSASTLDNYQQVHPHIKDPEEYLSGADTILENLVPWLQCLYMQVVCCEKKFYNVADYIQSTLRDLERLGERADNVRLLILVHKVIDCIIHLYGDLSDHSVKQRRFGKMICRAFYTCLRADRNNRWKGIRQTQSTNHLFNTLFSDALEQWIRPLMEAYINPCRSSPLCRIGHEKHLSAVDYLPFYTRHVYGYAHPSSSRIDHHHHHTSGATSIVTLEKLHQMIGPPNFTISTHDGCGTFRVHDWMLAARWKVYFIDLIRSGTKESSDRFITLCEEVTQDMLTAVIQSFYHPHICPPFIASNLFTLDLMKQYRLDDSNFPALTPIVPHEEEHNGWRIGFDQIYVPDVAFGPAIPANQPQQRNNPNNINHPLNGVIPTNVMNAIISFRNFANSINHHCINSTSIFQLVRAVLGDRLITPPVTSVRSFLDICKIGMSTALTFGFVHHPRYYLPRFLTISLLCIGTLGFGTISLLLRLINRFKRIK